jgi:hypothetical protein
MGLYGLVKREVVALTISSAGSRGGPSVKGTHLFNKVSGDMLDILWDDQVFYVERVQGGFVVVEGCKSAYFTRLTPVELIALRTELIVAGTGSIRENGKVGKP